MLPKAVRDLTQEFNKLPGIGPKTAQRLSLHLLRQPRATVGQMADNLKNLHANVRICKQCFNLSEKDTCDICLSEVRNTKVLCIVENPLDVEAIEKTGSYDGTYHVLGGVLSPLEGIGPDELTLNELMDRINKGDIKEIIIALDHKMESDATTRHIVNILEDKDVKITRLARGLPTGGDIEFADAMTLSAAIGGRREL